MLVSGISSFSVDFFAVTICIKTYRNNFDLLVSKRDIKMSQGQVQLPCKHRPFLGSKKQQVPVISPTSACAYEPTRLGAVGGQGGAGHQGGRGAAAGAVGAPRDWNKGRCSTPRAARASASSQTLWRAAYEVVAESAELCVGKTLLNKHGTVCMSSGTAECVCRWNKHGNVSAYSARRNTSLELIRVGLTALIT